MHLDENSCSRADSGPVDTDYPQNFSEALVSEIKAEMGRRDLSSRGLGRLIQKSSQYMSDRLDGGNSKTGKRVTLTITDLLAIAQALELEPTDLIVRAQRAIEATPDNVVRGRFGADVGAPAEDDLDAVARPTDPEPTDEQ